MKKFIYSIWAKTIATILCVLGMTGSVICILCQLIYSDLPDNREELLTTGYEQIAMNYSAYLLDNLDPHDSNTFELCEDKNMDYAIIKSTEEDLNDVNLTNYRVYLYNNEPATYTYVFKGAEIASYTYNIDSLYDALKNTPEAKFENTKPEKQWNNEVVYVASKEMYHFRSSSGFVPIVEFELDTSDVGRRTFTWRELNGKWCYMSDLGEEMTPWQFMEAHILYIEGAKAEINHSWIEVGTEKLLPWDIDYMYDELINYVYIEEEQDNYWVISSVNEAKGQNDLFAQWATFVHIVWPIKQMGVFLLAGMILLLFVSGLFLFYVLGQQKEGKDVKLHIWDKIPFEIYTLVMLVIVYLGVRGIEQMIRAFQIGFVLLVLAIVSFFILAYVMSVIVRVKGKCFRKYSLCNRTLACRTLTVVREQIPLFWKSLILFLFVTAIEFAIIFRVVDVNGKPEGRMIVIILLCVKIIELIYVQTVVLQMERLKEGGKRIAQGEIDNPIRTKHLFWEFKKHAENMNKIGDGIAIAVDEQMKSERFRTELITNVSHDIKTPLTSIINYVDLIQKENITDETAVEYIKILERQSNRLKKLIEDLMEASKASTGNLSVNMEECDVALLLIQAVGEFEEKARANQLELVVEHPTPPVNIMADGRHLWRVFDNLLNNICKYTLPGTRVYICMEQLSDTVEIVFKNISKAKLNISSDELLERFVRGDSSRNTEGSGLGLSIAQSLTELMGGTLDLEIDGDLFKATVRLHKEDLQEESV